MQIDLDTSEKIISLIAAVISIVTFLIYKKSKQINDIPSGSNSNQNTNTQSIVLNIASADNSSESTNTNLSPDIPTLKLNKRILFIDDKTFKIVTILRNMGWANTKLIHDISSLDEQQLREADVVFVDIQGVGIRMRYQDEGLGLAQAIKRRYPNKKVVIYSAQEYGERFHEALQSADYSLPKTAEPIRFEETILKVLGK